MRYKTENSMTSVSNALFRIFIFLVLCLFLLGVLLLCPGCDRDVSPPDLSSCTHIEIRYPRSTLDYFLPDSGIQDTVLSPKEKVHIKSIEFFTVNDPERIKAFSHDVSL